MMAEPTGHTTHTGEWTIVTDHGPDCTDCTWSRTRAEIRVDDKRGLAHTKTIVIRNSGHDATAVR